MKTLRLLLVGAVLTAFHLPSASVLAQGTAFTYQGVLSQGGAGVNGSSDLTFTLYNAASGGTTVGVSNVVNDLVMSNGLFAVTLDFGAGAFDGSSRWLQIAARPGASTGGYTNLAPRTPITATPYAIHAGGATAAGLVGALPASALAGVNGGGLLNLNAANLAGTVPTARLSTNVALRAGGNTFGGNQAFSDGNLSLAGTSTFEFGAGVAGKQISAGMIGYEAFTPGALDIVGAGNTAIERRVQLWDQVHVGNFDADEKPRLISFGDGEFVSIGENGADDRMELTAGAFVFKNGRVGIGAFSPASELEVAGTVTATRFSGDGSGLTGIDAGNLTGNLPDSSLSANVARRDEANIFSGDQRINSGSLNVPNGQISVGGALLVGGNQTVSGTVTANSFSGNGGGLTGIAAGSISGTLDAAQIPDLNASKITGGTLADARLSANVALRSGGNTFGGNQIFNGNVGIGTNAPATKLHLVGAGDTELSIESAANNRRWTLQASGGADGSGLGGTFQIIDRTAVAARMLIGTDGNVTIPAELTTTAVNITSDRNAKEQFKPVNAREVLDKVARLPISEWQYKTQGDARHIGPMAQDFRESFALGRDDKHITSVDADGVALAAIQGLNEKLEEQLRDRDQRILELERSMAELKAMLQRAAVGQEGGAK